MSNEPNCRVGLEIRASVATITLLRSDRLNAFDLAMHAELRAAFGAIADDTSIRAVVFTGSGRAFSAGQDLQERAAAFARGEEPDLGASLEAKYNVLVRAIAGLSVPVIAAVNGIAFGAGAALAIACDITLAAQSARFQFGFVNVGLGPDSGTSWFLPHRVGQAMAMDLALTGRPVPANEALAMGLVSRVVADEDLLETAHSIASDLAACSPQALAAIKRQMRYNAQGTLDAALGQESEAQRELGLTDAYRDAVLRFTSQKKSPPDHSKNRATETIKGS